MGGNALRHSIIVEAMSENTKVKRQGRQMQKDLTDFCRYTLRVQITFLNALHFYNSP